MADRLALADFIIAAIEEVAPGVDGRDVYLKAFGRFTDYCADHHRAASEAQLGKYPPPKPLRAITVKPIKRRIARPRGSVV